MKADLKRRFRVATKKAPEPTGELVDVDYTQAQDALLSHSQTELSISEAMRQHERQAIRIEADIARSRAAVIQCFKDAGLPFSPYERNYRWDPTAKAIYLMPKEPEAKPGR